MTDLMSAPALTWLASDEHSPLPRSPRAASVAPAPQCIHSGFEEWARRTPDALAVMQGADRITYAELDHRANCLASLLRIHGVRAGDRVGLFLRRSVPMVVGILATLKVGAAYVPRDPRTLHAKELSQIMLTTRTRVVLTLSQHVGRIPRSKGQAVIALDKLALDALTYDGSIPLVTPTDQVDPAVFTHSAGPTGRLRLVPVTHAALCNALLTEQMSFGIRPGMRVGQLLDISLVLAAGEIFCALSHGATLVIPGRVVEETLRAVDVVITMPNASPATADCGPVLFLDLARRQIGHDDGARGRAS